MAKYANTAETLRGQTHPDIDGIYYALQGMRPFKIADGLGDTYLEIWQLATMPAKHMPLSQSEQVEISRVQTTPDDLRRSKIIRRMAFLKFAEPDITRCLAIASEHTSDDLLGAYKETLATIKASYAITDQIVNLRVANLRESPHLLPWFLCD